MALQLPKYTTKDYAVLAVIILPFTLLLNVTVFGKAYFSGWGYFLTATAVSAVSFSLYFTLCGAVATLMKKRFPGEKEVPKRLAFMISTFLLMSGLFLLLLFALFEGIALLHYHFDENSFVWAYFGLGISNVFITFLIEGIARFESWKSNQQEMEALKKTYRQGRLQGLKSQVNPHFLFNSLNALSGLISDDEASAEKFLDEMSKVYRYMLRNEEDQLVTVATEMDFLSSYSYLLKARYGAGLRLIVDILENDYEKLLPPLSLQAIIENAIAQNSISKTQPLAISICSDNKGNLLVSNTLQPKLIKETLEAEAGLDNLVNKYHLLNQRKVIIKDRDTERVIRLPLIHQKKEEAV